MHHLPLYIYMCVQYLYQLVKVVYCNRGRQAILLSPIISSSHCMHLFFRLTFDMYIFIFYKFLISLSD